MNKLAISITTINKHYYYLPTAWLCIYLFQIAGKFSLYEIKNTVCEKTGEVSGNDSIV